MGFDPSTRRSVGPDPLPGLGAAGHSQDPHFVRDARAPRAVKLVHRASSALPEIQQALPAELEPQRQ